VWLAALTVQTSATIMSNHNCECIGSCSSSWDVLYLTRNWCWVPSSCQGAGRVSLGSWDHCDATKELVDKEREAWEKERFQYQWLLGVFIVVFIVQRFCGRLQRCRKGYAGGGGQPAIVHIPRPIAEQVAAQPVDVERPVVQHRELDSCMEMQRCWEFLTEKNINKDLFVREHDRCFCQECYKATDGMNSEPARGWSGFALLKEPRVPWQDWPVVYHGCSVESAKGILKSGHMNIPGDQVLDGQRLRAVKSAGRQTDGVFYTSPDPQYSGLKFYAVPEIGQGPMITGRYYQVMLQCHQKEATLKKKQAETMGFLKDREQDVAEWTQMRDKFCRNAEIEWLSQSRSECVVTRVLVREVNLDDCILHRPSDRRDVRKQRQK